MKHLEVLRAELERLFELEELTTLCQDVLGFDPELVGGQATLGSFAGALLAHCEQNDAIEALADALRSTGKDLNPAVAQIASAEPDEDSLLNPGDEFAGLHIARRLGEGRLGATYLAKLEGKDVRLKVLHPETTRDRRGLQRFLVLTRLAGQVEAPGLPKLINTPVDGERYAVAHDYIEGQPLATRVARTGPMHINEARPVIKGMIDAIMALHDKNLVHGALSLDNMITYRAAGGEQAVTLLDIGAARLRTRQSRAGKGLASTGGNPRTVSPEQIQGADADAKSDLYSIGAVMYELLSGKPVFDGDTLDMAFAHLTRTPLIPSQAAPRGWVTPDIDEVVLGLLDKDPGKRGTLAQLLDRLEDLGRTKRADDFTEDQLEELEQQLLGDPENGEVALSLESSVGRGASSDRVGQAFRLAASMIDDPVLLETKTGLMLRAARLLEQSDDTLEKAEAVYEELLGLDPKSQVAFAGLEDVRRRAHKYEELVEMLLSRAEIAQSAAERARAMADIGRVYLVDLEDHEQATVAYSQAYADDPCEEYATGVERAAGMEEQLWAEALEAVGQASQNEAVPQEMRTQLLLQAGLWYRKKVNRADLALPCLQAVLTAEPANDAALVELTEIYRRAQQWNEMGMMLTHRADAAATPDLARNLRAQSAELLEQRMNDLSGARAVFEQILEDDPSHVLAGEGLTRILEKLEDYEALVKHLEIQVAAQSGDDVVHTLCAMGELYEDRIDNAAEAISAYEKALSNDPTCLDGLRGLERIYSKQGQYKDLIRNLERQVAIAATPKQRIGLLERIAAINEEEFLDHEAAARALETALEEDAGRVDAMASLVRHLRVLERWEDASQLYERQLALVEEPSERVSLAMAWGRVLSEQIGSPERALHAFELVLQEDSEHGGALEALAKLRETTGDADRALEAIVSLAEQAATPEARAEQYLRAAELLESRGDRDRAIDHFKNALDAQPEDRDISAKLRHAYVVRGDINAAVELLERELDVTEGDAAQAKLAGEMSRLQRDKLKDDEAAETSATRALRLDPGNMDAILVLADICFEQARFVEASSHYGRIADRVESLGEEIAVPVLQNYVDALNKSGSTESALTAMDTLLRLAPDNQEAFARIAFVTFSHGAPKRAIELIAQYLEKFGDEMTDEEKALSVFRLGEAMRKSGDAKGAIPKLEEASEMDPGMEAPLIALAQAHTELEDWAAVVRAKTQHLDVADEEQRMNLLVEIGELYAEKLDDRTQAAKSFVAALEERPDDRRLLAKLMQLYSEEKDWNKLVEVVVKLADFVDNPDQKVKYLHTAALVTAREIGDTAQAAEFFEQVLDLEPANSKALEELIEIQTGASDHSAVEALLQRRLAMAEEKEDIQARIKTYDALGALYKDHLVDPERAAEAFEAANEIAPGDKDRLAKLADIYEADVELFKDKGIMLQEALLAENPFRQDSYKALRKIYTVARDADASWALCQVLTVLKLAEPDEERFYERMRAETAAPAQQAISEDDWYQRIMHPALDPLLTSVFALIEPAVVKARAETLETQGVQADWLIDPSQHQAPVAQTLYYAAGVMGVQLPAVYANPNDPGGVAPLITETPSLSLGRVGLSDQVPPQVAAFVAARQLAYERPGLYLRHFIQTGTAMKAWLFAAIKLTSPQFPIAPDLEGSVTENLAALKQHLPSDAKDHLSSVVSKLIQSGTSLDLKKWVAAVDLTADRAGLIVCHDLQNAHDVIQASGDEAASVAVQDRTRELILFGASSSYFEMRRALGITVES